MRPMRAVASAGHTVEFATQWQGQVIDGKFPLEQYLAGTDRQAVFLTRTADGSARAAIKVMRASGFDPEAQLSAWRRAATLSHPHLIRILDAGRCWLSGQELLFVVSEFAEENLAQVLPQRALSPDETESMLRPVLNALGYLHAQGLVHGHMRPSNVMAIGEQVKVSSDGIQAAGRPLRAVDESPYDAPELAASGPTPESDVWSLGKLVTEALIQRVPSRIERTNLPQPFADIVEHCLVEYPASRWKIRELSAKLEPVRAKAGSTAIDSPRPAGVRSRGPIWIAIALLITAVVIAAFFVHRGSSGTQPLPQAGTAVVSPPASPSVAAVQDSRGMVVKRSLPTPSRSALNTIQGRVKVRVKVAVDAKGRVNGASFISSGPSQYFARLALQAAQEWKFAPAIRNGQPVSSEWNLLFEYSRGGVQASEQKARER